MSVAHLLQVYDLVIDRRFEYFMLFWIVMSCGQMMAERPSFSHTSLPHKVHYVHAQLPFVPLQESLSDVVSIHVLLQVSCI